MTRPVEVFSSAEGLAERACFLVERSVDAAWEEGRVARLALSGGSTPRGTYEALGERGKLGTERVEIFFADERCVPPSDHASNYRLVAETIGDHGNVRRIRGEAPPEEAAEEYEALLRERFGDGQPAFDLILLGIGPDGHTASLFPGEPEVDERRRWVVATKREHAWVRRVSLTLPVLNAARQPLMLATGREKAKAVAGVLSGGTSPAARVLAARLLLDEAAAGAGAPPERKRAAKPPTDELLDLGTEGDAE